MRAGEAVLVFVPKPNDAELLASAAPARTSNVGTGLEYSELDLERVVKTRGLFGGV